MIIVQSPRELLSPLLFIIVLEALSREFGAGVPRWDLYADDLVIIADSLEECLFVWFDSLRPINNLSVNQGRVFLGWTSTKLG